MQVVKLMKKKGTSMVLVDSAGAGDIVSMAGLMSPAIGHTVANVEVCYFMKCSDALFILFLMSVIRKYMSIEYSVSVFCMPSSVNTDFSRNLCFFFDLSLKLNLLLLLWDVLRASSA